MNLQRTAALVACVATLSLPAIVLAHTMSAPAIQVAQSATDDERYKLFLQGVTNLSDLTEVQKKQMMQAVASAAQSTNDSDSSANQQVALERRCEREIWHILTPTQQSELHAQDSNLYPPS